MKLVSNLPAKIGGLVSALALFWYVQANRTITRDVQIRVARPSITKNLIFASKIPVYMNVRLSGPRESMDFPLSDFRIHLTNPNPRPLERPNIYAAVLLPELPKGVKHRFDDSVEVLVDRKEFKTLPVDPVLLVNLKDGLEAGYFDIKPRTIRIFGPRRIVSKMERLRTRPIVVDGPTRNADAADKTVRFTGRKLIKNLPTFVRLAPKQPRDVEFTMLLRDAKQEKPERTQELDLEGISLSCVNNVGRYGFRVKSRNPINIRVRYPTYRAKPRASQFDARMHCPLVWYKKDVGGKGEKARKVWWPREVNDLPVYVRASRSRSGVEIISVSNNKVNIEWERIVRKSGTRKKAENIFVIPNQ